MRQIAQYPPLDFSLNPFGQDQNRLAEQFRSLGVPAMFDPRTSYGVFINSKDIATSGCNLPICRLLRRVSKVLKMEITIELLEDSNHFQKIHPEKINLNPNDLRNVSAVEELVNLKIRGLSQWTSHPTEVLIHELTHLIFFKHSRGKDHFFLGRYHLVGIPSYPYGLSFDEVLTYGLANFAREKLARKHFKHRTEVLYFPDIINAFLNEIADFFPIFKEFALNHPLVQELADASEFRVDSGIVDVDLIREKYKPLNGMVALTIAAHELPYRGHNSGALYYHIFLAANGRSYEFYSNYKIQDIKNWPDFFEQQAKTLSTFFDITDSKQNPNLRSIRNAFANPENRFRAEPVTCEGLF